MSEPACQLSLFESFEGRSQLAGPRSAPSSELSTCSSASDRAADATSTTPSLHAKESSQLDGAPPAETPSDDASNTVDFGRLPTLPMFTEARTVDPMLAIPRPRTRTECMEEARPCPWTGCRHHLLIEVSKAKLGKGTHRRELRPTKIRLNTPGTARTWGRRRGLGYSADELTVQAWFDDALETLTNMEYSCALDVARDFPDGLPPRLVALLLGVSEQQIEDEIEAIKRRNDVREMLAEWVEESSG